MENPCWRCRLHATFFLSLGQGHRTGARCDHTGERARTVAASQSLGGVPRIDRRPLVTEKRWLAGRAGHRPAHAISPGSCRAQRTRRVLVSPARPLDGMGRASTQRCSVDCRRLRPGLTAATLTSSTFLRGTTMQLDGRRGWTASGDRAWKRGRDLGARPGSPVQAATEPKGCMAPVGGPPLDANGWGPCSRQHRQPAPVQRDGRGLGLPR